MEADRPAPGEEINTGAPTVPRQAASVIVLRGGSASLEVLLLRRNPAARFMGGAWVFPGGAVDPSDVAEGEREERASRLAGETPQREREERASRPAGETPQREREERASRPAGETPQREREERTSRPAGETPRRERDGGASRLDGDAALRAAAVREVREEAGLTLPDPAALVRFSRWITPPEITIRFDTHFFLAPTPAEQEPSADGQEMVDLGWHTPAGALEAGRRGELDLVFPTIKHLEQLAGFDSADALLAWATGRDVVAVEPRVLVTGETARVVLPGDPGYED